LSTISELYICAESFPFTTGSVILGKHRKPSWYSCFLSFSPDTEVVRCECLLHLGTWSPGVRLHFTVSTEGWDRDFFVFFLYLLSRVGHPGPRNVQFLKNIRDFPLLHLYLFSLTTRPPNHGCPLVIIEFIMNR
jgi:hypothetical protein